MHRILIIIGLTISLQSYSQDYNHVLVFLNSHPDKEEISSEEEELLRKAHFESRKQMAEEGKILLTGPFDGGGGIYILNTGKISEAKSWLQTDPTVLANRWQLELFPLRFLQGGICDIKEPYDMVRYNFIRIKFINEIANYKTNETGSDVWSSIIKSENIKLTGVFPHSDGGLIIYNGDKKTSWFGTNQANQMTLEHKLLWLANGAICD